MHSKQLITLAITAAVAASLALPALAQDLAASVTPHPEVTNRGIVRPVIEPKIPLRSPLITRLASRSQELRERVASVSDNIKQRLTDAKKKLLTKWWADINKRLGALITRQGKLAGKIQERITKLSGQGVDVTAAQTALNGAQTAITTAQAALTAANGQVAGIIADNTPADAFSKLRDMRKTVLAAVRTAQKALIDAALATRMSHASPSPSASASPTS